MDQEDILRGEFSRSDLRKWLETNASQRKECWVQQTAPKGKETPEGIPYLEIVEEALCFGWIDSVKKRLEPDGPVFQRISPRRKGCNWTELNKERCRRLIRLGLMTTMGKAVLPSLDPDDFKIEKWVMDAISADPAVYENFLKQPPLYRRVKIDNIQTAVSRTDRSLALQRLEKYINATREGKLFGEWNDKGIL